MKALILILTTAVLLMAGCQAYGTNTTPGTTNMSAATSDWLDVGLQGVPLVVPSEEFLLSSWTQKNITADVKIVGLGNAKFTGTASSSFINPANGDVDIEGVHFDTWLQVIENSDADATTTDFLRIHKCKFTTLTGIPVSHGSNLNKAWITDNYFNNISPASNLKGDAL